ncbi:tetratricopeptide repeat protein [Fischerella thermalis]|uniref:Tetratricopeptide TPR_2 repeat-containing protein n=1 Tax=Fischerella thermalis JSC-11 TaxID=741277 RepID=G6FYT6_9CYAN|nr:tetratricopeptide repeat protein [Fischerella thermalis]PMB06995.1 Tfp pilus assembly protein PilF [Fischerella thermalis CCMEE 5273]EHC09398.1 Tetratricopeptide TPR_2 repeat-containing protein [Fischerella thermalis JSC-11]PLZ07771.1 Tfp pilus assembly protein PilF [Fischerella thermalis WC119]PLZ10111.1 Tfp pilus assembly protein PilF [Fischerella thermalis WC1110]PLZ13734.1 Tfp pilus assembly protein PilF [Fischerella thermalis WC114]
MSQPRNRWLVKVVLVLAVIAFVGVSMVPIIAAFNDTQQPSSNSASGRGNSSSSDQKAKLEDAARGYEQVLQREPENQTALRGLLETRLQLLSLGAGNIKAVIEPLEKLAKLNPEQTRYGVLLAQAKQQIGDKEGAAQAYRSILETKPGNLEALQGMVALLLNQKRPEAAIGLLQDTLAKSGQANKIEPGSVDTVAVQVMLGNVYASQKRYPQALSLYDQAVNIAPDDFRPVLAKAMVIKEQGKADEAKPLFDKAAALAPAQYKDEINKRSSESVTPTPAATSAPTP